MGRGQGRCSLLNRAISEKEIIILGYEKRKREMNVGHG